MHSTRSTAKRQAWTYPFARSHLNDMLYIKDGARPHHHCETAHRPRVVQPLRQVYHRNHHHHHVRTYIFRNAPVTFGPYFWRGLCFCFADVWALELERIIAHVLRIMDTFLRNVLFAKTRTWCDPYKHKERGLPARCLTMAQGKRDLMEHWPCTIL